MKGCFPVVENNRRTPTPAAHGDSEYVEALERLATELPYSWADKFEMFATFAPRWALMRFLTKYEMLKQILDVEGVIIECGVYRGRGVMSWAQLSAILEPWNHQRRVVGFDTFAGFPGLTPEDGPVDSKFKYAGAWAADSEADIYRADRIHGLIRPMGQIPKVELVRGDLADTAQRYVDEHRHLVVALLYLDVDLYVGTKAALQAFWPRIPKGGIVGFDEINTAFHPGETQAVHELLGLGNLRIKRFPFGTSITYAVKE